MASHNDVGRYGENLAENYLVSCGYQIICVNWRYKYWEVDIIARDGDCLVFIEVKSRKTTLYGDPADFVDEKKQHNLIKAAEEYIYITSYIGEIRFDIVSVYLKDSRVELIKDAFWSN